jgi:hypothetical protein
MTSSGDANYFFRNVSAYLPNALNEMEPNEYFEDDVFAYDDAAREKLKLFVLGPVNSSTFWHGE